MALPLLFSVQSLAWKLLQAAGAAETNKGTQKRCHKPLDPETLHPCVHLIHFREFTESTYVSLGLLGVFISPAHQFQLVWCFYLFIYLFIYCLFAISWASPEAYGGSQARGQIGAVATGLCQSHSNAGSEPRLWPTLQLTATPDR